MQRIRLVGRLSLLAMAKSRASIYKFHTAKRFTSLLSGAFILVRAVREYGAVGIDLGGIAIWGNKYGAQRDIKRLPPQ